MANYRIARINEQMTCEMAEIIRDIKDPRVQRALVTVTHCAVTPDLKYAKVYYSVIGDRRHAADSKALHDGLLSAQGYIRRRLAQTLNLRITPELSFYEDESIAHGAHINELLHGVADELRRADERDAAEQEAQDGEAVK